MQKSRDLTTGPLGRSIFFYSLPLVFTYLLEMLFNIADMVIAGKYAGDRALGAIGSTPQMMFFCMGFLMGMGGAVNAIAAYFIGGKKTADLEQTVHTGAIISFFAGLFFYIMAFFLGRPVLLLLNTKAELFEDALLYFRICSLGFVAMGIYNWGNGILSAAGDTKSPLVYLVISGGMNVILNITFIVAFKMTVDGVAWATVISQFTGAVMVTVRLIREKGDFSFSFGKLRINKGKALQILKLGIPSGMQNAIFAFANSFLQAAVNSFESALVVANSAAINIDNILYSVNGAFYNACASFIGQNYGAGNKKRVLNSYLVCLGFAVLAAWILGGTCLFFSRQIMTLFSSSPRVIELGRYRIAILACSIWIAAFMDGTTAASRGLGHTLVPTAIIIMGSCIFRIIWILTVFARFHTILVLFMVFPVSWTITGAAEIVYFLSLYRKIEPKTGN